MAVGPQPDPDWPDCPMSPSRPEAPGAPFAPCAAFGVSMVTSARATDEPLMARNPYTLEPTAAGATGASVTSLIETPVTLSARAACGEPMIVVGCSDVWVHASSLYPPLMVTLLISEMPAPSL